MFWNPVYYLFALPALLLALFAQWKVRAAYGRYMRVPNAAGITGLDAARLLLARTGLNVRIEGVQGTLTDHYDPRTKTLRLSPGVAQSASIGALAIVAHETGHAIQDARAFALLRLRSGLVPIVNFTSWLGPILFMIGWLLNYQPLASVGVLFFSGAVVFALLTLPVELDASHRGIRLLEDAGLVSGDEDLKAARSVLSAAALTYVAALAQSVSTLLYYLFLLSGSSRQRRRL